MLQCYFKSLVSLWTLFLQQAVHSQCWYTPETLPRATWRRFKSLRLVLKQCCLLIIDCLYLPLCLISVACCWSCYVPFPSSGFSLDCCWRAGSTHAGAQAHPTKDHDLWHCQSMQHILPNSQLFRVKVYTRTDLYNSPVCVFNRCNCTWKREPRKCRM